MPTTNTLRVALAQVDCTLGDLATNFERVRRLIRQHRDAADLMVFPELTLTGYAVGTRYHQYALRRDDPRLLELAQETKGTRALVGFIEETPRFEFFNSLALVESGELRAVHRKIVLPNYGIFEEKKHFSAGETLRLWELGPFHSAPFICADAWNPALAHVAALEGASLMTFSVNSPDGGLGAKFSSQDGWKRLARFYASMYGVYVAFVNRTGREADLSFWGESELIDPYGRQVAACGRGEEVVIAPIDLGLVREARTVLHTIRDDDPALIRRHLDRVIESRHQD
jgi:predicted amidohydrolase